jgi:hypothetical protein
MIDCRPSSACEPRALVPALGREIGAGKTRKHNVRQTSSVKNTGSVAYFLPLSRQLRQILERFHDPEITGSGYIPAGDRSGCVQQIR